MNTSRGLAAHYAVRALLLLGFAGLIVYLVRTDNILYYIAPRMIIYVKLSAFGLYAIAVYQMYRAFRLWQGRPAAACECEHPPTGSWLKHAAIYAFFAFPLLLAVVLPDMTMGSALAAKKGVNLSSASSVRPAAATGEAAEAPAPNAAAEPSAASGAAETETPAAAENERMLDGKFAYDEYTEAFAKHASQLYREELIQVPEELYMETLTTLDLYMDQFAGKSIELSGFVYREEGMSDRQFVIGRFSIQCCSADAAPFGVLVEYDRAAHFANDAWLRITGTLDKSNYNGNELLTIRATKLTKIEAPKNQYVYPNFDFGS